MDQKSKDYPFWIKMLLGIYVVFGIIRAVITFLATFSYYPLGDSIIQLLGTLLLAGCLILIINKKFWGYVLFCLVSWSQVFIEQFCYGYASDAVYTSIIIRIILISLLVFIPFRKGRSIFNTMMPIWTPFNFKWSKPRLKSSIEIKLNENENQVAVSGYNCVSPQISMGNYEQSSQPTLIDKPKNKENGILTRLKFKDWHLNKKLSLFLLLFFLIITLIIFVSTFFRHTSSNEVVYLDRNKVFHVDSHCSSIAGASEIMPQSNLLKQAAKVRNVTSPSSNLRYCGNCVSAKNLSEISNNVDVYIKSVWGTNNQDTLDQLVADIQWLYDNSHQKYKWANEEQCLRYFKNPQNALNYYINESQFYNLGKPDEYIALLEPLLTNHISNDEITMLAHRKLIYDILVYHGYSMEEFRNFLDNINRAQSREKLYYALKNEVKVNSNKVPIGDFEDFQTWLGY